MEFFIYSNFLDLQTFSDFQRVSLLVNLLLAFEDFISVS